MTKRTLFYLFCFLLLLLLASGHPALADSSYTVRAGDTLSSIARAHGVTVAAIADANNIVNPNLIFVGQVLTIPDGAAPVATPEPPASDSSSGSAYVVQPGDTLLRIAVRHGVTLQAVIAANNLANPNVIFVGQRITIPGASGGAPVPPAPTAPPSATATAAPPEPPPPSTGANLLLNPSFEEGYYNLYGAPELQVPNHWSMEIDEGFGAPDTGLTYLRPESRIVPRAGLPVHEQPLFLWEGNWTLKVFKGGAPVSFRLLTDVNLQPGTYRFVANYFPDVVAGYGGGKVWAPEANAAEVRFIQGNGGSGWRAASVGQKNTLAETFTVSTPGAVRLGVAFRAQYTQANNGFFVDDWSLQSTGTP